MAYYHFVYKDVKGASTQWDDIQRKLGNLPSKAHVFKPSPFTPTKDEDSKPKDEPVGSITDRIMRLEDLEDDLDDDHFLQEYMRKRLAEMKQVVKIVKFGSIIPISRSDFVCEVPQAPSDVGYPECGVLMQCMEVLDNNGADKEKYTGLHTFGRRCIPEGSATIEGDRQPAHDKQGFERTIVLLRLGTRLIQIAKDQVSFAIVLWELLTALTPFGDMTLEQAAFVNARPPLHASCPRAFRQLISRCWSGKPERRPDFDEIVSILEIYAEHVEEDPDILKWLLVVYVGLFDVVVAILRVCCLNEWLLRLLGIGSLNEINYVAISRECKAKIIRILGAQIIGPAAMAGWPFSLLMDSYLLVISKVCGVEIRTWRSQRGVFSSRLAVVDKLALLHKKLLKYLRIYDVNLLMKMKNFP
ncbi:phosducin-like protein 3 [Tanacetum coccineum]